MELSKQEKLLMIRALRIAKENIQIVFSKNQIDVSIRHPELAYNYVEMQSDLIEELEKCEKLMDKLRETPIKNYPIPGNKETLL